MVDVAGLFGIAFMAVTLVMTVALTWLGLQSRGPAAASEEEGEDDEAAAGA